MQLFARQVQEDGEDPSTKWGQDIPAPDVAEVEDPDDEDQLPIPAAGAPISGKPRARASIRDWSDDDDCEMLEVIDARPIAYAHPASASANPGGSAPSARPAASGKQVGSRKRAETGTSKTGTSTSSDSAAPQAKRQKRGAVKPK